MGFPGGSVVKSPAANAGEAGSIPVSGRSPGAGNSNPLQYSSLGNPMDRGAWQARVHGVTEELDTLECTHTHHMYTTETGIHYKPNFLLFRFLKMML